MKVFRTIWTLTLLFLFGLMAAQPSSAQKTEERVEPPPVVEAELEDVVAQLDDAELEDDEWLQQMSFFRRHPVNLNEAGEPLLQELKLLSPVQIDALLEYRRLFGPLLSIYELQAVPGWHVAMIRKLLPFVTVSQRESLAASFRKKLTGGESTLLLRNSRVLEQAEGYTRDGADGRSFYPGSPNKILMRYKYRYGNNLQYGITAEKDAGEQFFKGAQKVGFDFYSMHFFLRRAGFLRVLAVGDFSVNLGQGLIQWQGLSFNGASEILSIKRQSQSLRPYSSAGEFNFYRGAGVVLERGQWQLSAFGSYRKFDAGTDTSTQGALIATSLRQSGFHRTTSEIAGRGGQKILAAGGSLKWRKGTLELALNSVGYRFAANMKKEDFLYNLFSFGGGAWGNHSVDFGYTYKNAHAFGEFAVDAKWNKAFIGGVVISTNTQADISFLYRTISPYYQSFFSSAFTRGASVNNEKGLYTGINVYPVSGLQITASADFFSFPWLKYRIDAPAEGSRYLLQIQYKPKREIDFYSRYQHGNNPLNEREEWEVTNTVGQKQKQSWRNQFSYKLSSAVTLRGRVEIVWYDKAGKTPEEGFLFFTDLLYKPLMKPWSGNFRIARFETDSYNSRVYAFENDVRFSYSIPAFYDKGYRFYINTKFKIIKGLDFWVRFAQTMYDKRQELGSGLDRIKGNRKSEVKVQFMYSFQK